MIKINLKFFIFVALCCLFFSACVKDTDFDQADDIVLSPVVELDLIYFNLRASDFVDTVTGNPRLTVTDTTEIEFLDGSFLQENLARAEFYFKFTNSIPRSFEVDFQFLSEANDTTYTTQTVVNEGSVSSPVITEFIENVEGEQILQLTSADKVVVSVTVPSSTVNVSGELNLKSKTTYFLEY
ncbi:hypothetical protein [Aequorivita echinoideorum]|uniref:DUF1735 domain-containing protein n=1 Tax=Aequorivita echinoideorum TaxID=1549647 RepID=A0ABS5S440_9FLAO|nr:hypothetical protein [Aequorivita echinoideorum]MBT0606610.1 hypothetical protein [Aequorivita echinoideorum]